MMPALHLVPPAIFAALMATAAVEDLRRLVIPNQLIVALLILWPAQLAAEPAFAPSAVVAAVACAAAVFCAGALLFSRGLIGGGDVKLLSAAALWAGAGAVPALLILTALFGGVLSLLLLTSHGMQLGTARGGGATARPPVPYGVAIAAAALLVTIPPNFG